VRRSIALVRPQWTADAGFHIDNTLFLSFTPATTILDALALYSFSVLVGQLCEGFILQASYYQHGW
jgi:hypothetical protein